MTNHQTRGLTLISQILRCHTNRAEWKESVVSTNFGRTLHCDMGNQMATLPQLHLSSDHAIGANLARGVNFGLGIDNRGGMNAHD